jgi:ethanolamine utilization microcompartment shell protein EutL
MFKWVCDEYDNENDLIEIYLHLVSRANLGLVGRLFAKV